ncbi:hypothetical protein C7818_11712 [Leuconostoc mesenteroides]|uniref:hypothetical protein n=1 Tax=Leuconostoc mesenteroides TaxID=1245 RepID=UPI0010662A05|nr:hypothetical protein [Leuconostoc mesenteroides]TDV88493.1 hypothetical protein C7818_11712 [Leuconostoc mesenteroides]
MKIVSLQSVGLGTFYVERTINEPVYVPYYVAVGAMVDDLRGGYEGVIGGDKITVTEITHLSDYVTNKEANDILPDYYKVHTSDGHIRVLPADKYIAEWSK